MTVAFISSLSSVEAAKAEFAWSLGSKMFAGAFDYRTSRIFWRPYGHASAPATRGRHAARLATGKLDVVLPGLNSP